jgi:ABC-type multidrug transport system fused ATPase/permease subunit
MTKTDKREPPDLSDELRRLLLRLALHFVPAVNEQIDFPDALARQVLAARPSFKKLLREEAPRSVNFFRPESYLEKSSVQDNILFGRITSEDAEVKNRITTLINRLLVEEELLEVILDIGMNFQVGRSGENLSGGQRQKLALARALLKNPSILLLDEATASLDNKSQDRVQKVLESRWKGQSTLVAVVHRLDIIKSYDTIAVMDSGRIVEMGPYDELMGKKGLLYRLVQNTSGS